MNSFLSYIQHNKLSLLMAIIPSGAVIGFMPYNELVYYAWCIIVFVWTFVKIKSLSLSMVSFIIACAFSIFFNDVPPVFRSWERLGLFVLVVNMAYPLMNSGYQLNKLRFNAFNYGLWLTIFIGITSLICYFLGINYMNVGFQFNFQNSVGWFGGITLHSMLLGPLSGIGAISSLYVVLQKQNKQKKLLWFVAFICCMCSCMASASRIALAATLGGSMVLYFLQNAQCNKLIRSIIVAGIFAAALYPVYEPFLNQVMKKQRGNVEASGTFNSRDAKWNYRIQEFDSSPLFGIGFASVDWNVETDVKNERGIVEPGSSWLGILSMTGLFGITTFLIVVLRPLFNLYKRTRQGDTQAALLVALLVYLYIHMSAEGYMLAAGSYLFYFSWLMIGSAEIYSRGYNTSDFKLLDI